MATANSRTLDRHAAVVVKHCSPRDERTASTRPPGRVPLPAGLVDSLVRQLLGAGDDAGVVEAGARQGADGAEEEEKKKEEEEKVVVMLMMMKKTGPRIEVPLNRCPKEEKKARGLLTRLPAEKIISPAATTIPPVQHHRKW